MGKDCLDCLWCKMHKGWITFSCNAGEWIGENLKEKSVKYYSKHDSKPHDPFAPDRRKNIIFKKCKLFEDMTI
jgi:hypothetical protein